MATAGDRPAGVSPVVTAACVLAGIALLAAGSAPFQAVPPQVTVWGTALALFALGFYGFRVSSRLGDHPWFAPLCLSPAFFFFKYGWGCLVAFYWGSARWEVFPELRTYFYRFGVWDNLPTTCRLFLLGGIGLFLGASLGGGPVARALSRLNWAVSPEKLKHNVALVSPAILLVYSFLWVRTGGVLPYSVVALASIIDGLTVLAGYYCFSARRRVDQLKWAAFIALICALRLRTALSSGQMVPILTPVLMLLFGYTLARRRMPWKWMALALPLALFFALPFMALYKFVDTEGGIGDRLALARQQFAITGYEARLELALARTLARLCGAQFPAVFAQYYPGVYPFDYGRSFLIEASGLVPRLLWHDKPEISPELNRYSEGVGLVRADSGTSAVFDALSEYYVNFGALGVLLLFGFHGWYLAVIYDWLVRRGNYLVGSAVYLCLIPGNWDFFGIVNQLTSHVKLIPVWLALLYFMSRKTR